MELAPARCPGRKNARDCPYFGQAKGLLGHIDVEGSPRFKKLVAAGGLHQRLVIWSHSAWPFPVNDFLIQSSKSNSRGGITSSRTISFDFLAISVGGVY